MANSFFTSVTATPLPEADSLVDPKSSDSVPVHIVLKILCFPYEFKAGTHKDMKGIFSGIPYQIATTPEEIEASLKPLLETSPDISGEWKIANLAVVGGFYCTLGKDNEVKNPTGIIIPPSRQNKYGTIDIAKEPNGLLYILLLQNRAGFYWQTLYFDPQRDIKEGRIDNESRISFPKGPKKPNLQVFADVGQEEVNWLGLKRTKRVAQRPIGPISCYTLGDITVEWGKTNNLSFG